MFGQNRPAFGTSTGTTFGGFGANTSSAFGQSPFGAKQTGTSTTAFQTPAFGTNTAMFGGTGTTTSQASGGLFGTPAPAFGTTQPTTGFGAPSGTTGFGATGPSTGFGFGAGTTGGGIFGAAAPSTGLFGAAPQPTAAGTAPGTGTGGLFGAPATTGFGAQKPAFGFSTGTSSGLFGQPQPQATQSTTLFGQTSQPTSSGSLFGSAPFGGAFGGTTGTTIKFNPPVGTDSMVKNNLQTNISTRHQCISCMKEYENKSLEELRLEDYAAGRRGPGVGSQPGNMFGNPTTSQPTSLFGQSQKTGLFGSTPTGIGTNTSLFGKPVTGFGQPTTSTTASFGFGQPQTTGGLFGQPQQAKPFGTGPSIFGAPTTSQPSTAFGTPAPTSGFGFGTAQPATSSVFGTPRPPFGSTTTSTAFAFGQPTATSTSGGGLFGTKPTTGFGATPAPAFGAPTSSAAPGFTNLGTGFFGSTAGTTPFGAKPATGGLTFGTATTSAPSFSFGTSTGTSLFGAPSATVAKPGGLFGTGGNFGAGGFGTTPAFGATAGLTSGLGSTTTGLNFGTASTGAPGGSFAMAPQTATSPPSSGQLPIHQYILTLAESSQSSDYPLFRKILEPSGKREELIKSAAPATSASTTSAVPSPQYRISPHPGSKLRAKPLLNGSASSGRRSIFEGLDEEEQSEELVGGIESKTNFFVPRRSVKKLQLKTVSLDGTGVAETNQQNVENSTVTPPQEEINYPDGRPDVRQSEDLDDTATAFNIRRPPPVVAMNASILDRSNVLDETTGIGDGERTVTEEIDEVHLQEDVPPHPTGIVLRRAGYYTIPSMEELGIKGLDEKGKCVVDSFTIGRHNYGSIFFKGPLNVAGLNLDQIVIFRHKEVTVYPDDEKKPAEGEELNRRAEVTLDRVWPVDKSTGEYITDPERLHILRYEERLARAANRLGARFVEYRPETGSWVFRVNHFSKYGLEDSDEENELPLPAQTGTLPHGQAAQIQTNNQGLGGTAPCLATTVHPSLISAASEEEMGIDDEVMVSKDMMVNEFEEAARIVSPPPIATQLAHSLGMPSQRVQIMKASFFETDSEYNMDISMGIGNFSSAKTPKPLQPMFSKKMDMSLTLRESPEPSPKSQRHLLKSSFKEPDGMKIRQYEQSSIIDSPKFPQADTSFLAGLTRLENGLKHPEQPAKVVPRFAYAEAQTANSLMQNMFNIISDLGLFHNRRFRPGWGPDLKLVTLDSDHLSSVSVKSVDTSDFEEDNEGTNVFEKESKSPYVVLLSTYLEHAERKIVKGIPAFYPRFGTEALEALKNSTNCLLSRMKFTGSSKDLSLIKYMSRVWTLALALWGPLEEEPGTHAEIMARKDSFSHWLETTAAETDIHYLEGNQILGLLSQHDVCGAVRLAQKNGDHCLALMLSQAASSSVYRGMIQRQLQLWIDNRADLFITKDRLRLFAILSGIPVWKTTDKLINTCENMDWIKSFGHHLWYVISPAGSIADALTEYEKACGIATDGEMLEPFAAQPHPPYSEGSSTLRDLCFQLISLYCRRTTPLEGVVNPLSHTWNAMENMLSWLLWQQLQALGYSHLSESAAAQLTTSFASQLENCGLWPWSVFLLLHLNGPTSVVQVAVEEVIVRHVNLHAEDGSELFLKEKLGIPAKWIESARAVKAQYSSLPHLHAQSLLNAELYSQAHDVICDKLAPEAILAERYQDLERLLRPLSEPENCSLIAEWPIKGKVYWTYIIVAKTVDSILKQENFGEKGLQLEKLTPDLLWLCNVIGSLPVPTAKHKLVRTEIAQKAAYILKNIISSQTTDGAGEAVIPPRFVLPQLRQLPVTQDYSLQELNNVVRAYFLELDV